MRTHRPTILFSVPTLNQKKAARRLAPVSCYGTSETLCLTLYCDIDGGRLTPTPLTELRYDALAPELPQRLGVRHPAVARGCWQRPKEQADGFHGGWFSPGDMFLRQEGWLEFAGGNDDMLKIAGQWVSTQWVEQALRTACGGSVQTLAAIGVKCDDGLTAIAAFLVKTPGQEAAAPAAAWPSALPACPATSDRAGCTGCRRCR